MTKPGLEAKAVNRPDLVARSRALNRLARAYPLEFAGLLRAERQAMGLPPAPTGHKRRLTRPEEFRRRWDEGESAVALGTSYGVEPNTVWRWAREMGLKPRSRLGRPPGPSNLAATP